MKFVQSPNLPDSDVALVAMSGTYQQFVQAVRARGIEVIEIRDCAALPKPVASHADMLIHHLGADKIVMANGEEYLENQLTEYGFCPSLSNVCVSNNYPGDVILNAARVGNNLFAKLCSFDHTIKNNCEIKSIKMLPVNQGYAKCSTVVVDETSIITADCSIANAASAAGLDVLRITPGYVELKGYDYGFLGGACGKLSKNLLAFTGSIETHPDYKNICSFCNGKNVEILSLTDSALMDIGGILPLKVRI